MKDLVEFFFLILKGLVGFFPSVVSHLYRNLAL